MGLFGNSQSPLENEIERATSETNTIEKWSLIMDICDKIGSSQANAKESLRIITKRLNHADPHVVMQAITLLDACVNNCGKNYHLEVASREFELEFKRLVGKSEPQVANKLKQSLKKWAEGDFKSDPQLNLIPSLYKRMQQEGHDFSEPQSTVKREVQKSNDPNVVSSQQEEDDIAKAIELSLKEAGTPKKNSSSARTSSLYPSMNSLTNNNSSSLSASASAAAPAIEPRKVRALYDFEAAEDNELTFKAGEVIMVIEESDPNWWRGTNQRGEGFFPANFVTADLSAEPEDFYKKETRKANKSNDVSHEERKPEQPVEINEEAIDRLLFLLHEADPEDPSTDTDEMLRLENFVTQMGPLIDSELERVDRKHAQLTQLSSDLIDTINLYHSLMRDTEKAPMRMPHNSFSGMPGRQFYPNSSNMYGGMPHMGIHDPMNAAAASAFPPQMTPDNYHMMHPHANMLQQPPPQQQSHMTHNQNPNLPPPEQMMQQFAQHHNSMGMGQMPQIPAGIYQNNVGAMQQPQDSSRIPSQDMNQAAAAQQQQQQPTQQLSGTTFPQQQQQNHNLAQNYSLPPLQQHQNRMMAPNYPMTANQMMPPQPNQQQPPPPMQINEMMANMALHSMSNVQQMNYPPQQTSDATNVPLYHQP